MNGSPTHRKDYMDKAEQETTLTYDMGERVVRVFSAIKRDQNRLEKAGVKPYRGTPGRGFFYRMPMSRLRWRVASLTPSKRGFGNRPPKPTHSNTVYFDLFEAIPNRTGRGDGR